MKTFKVAIVGCGGMAQTWIQYALTREDTQIVALVDVNEDQAKKTAKKFNLSCPTYTDLTNAIHLSTANLVFDVTIPATHRQVTTTALNLGCDVFGEKPMGASLEDAKEMLKIAQQSGKSYVVMQNRRYNKQIRGYRDVVQSGTIGEQGMICADFFLGPHFGGFREVMESPLILDMAIHTFDQARFISGANPVSVYCHEFNPSGSWYKGNAAAICIFEMDNGAAFSFRGSWCAEGAPTSWEASWRVTGSKGTAIWDGTHVPYYEAVLASEGNFLNEGIRQNAELTWQGKEGHFGCLDEMFASLKEKRKAETDSTDNIKSVSMVYGAIESAKTGQKITL